ncbi:MAG TPA: lysozyme inhibitor LprI family protein [Scandinavium sp.]
MKLVKFTPAVLALIFSVNVHAGLFSSSDDFKCGRDDAVKALQQYVKDNTSAMIQSDSLKKASILLNKPADVYMGKLDSLSVNIKNVSTTGNTSVSEISCEAQVDVPLPTEALDVIHAMPEKMSDLHFRNAKFYNGAVVWKNYTYTLKLADNKKDISVVDSMNNSASAALYGAVVLAVNKNEIIKANAQDKVAVAKNDYLVADADLNATWKVMPASARNSLKSAQLAWVKSKAAACGKISDADLATTSAETSIQIYNCQTKMTNERNAFLGGDN